MSNVTTTSRGKSSLSTLPTIYNISMPLAATEYSQSISPGTKKILIRMRNKARAKVAFVSGDTATLYFTIEPGAVYFDENLDLVGVTIYLQSNVASQVAEILEWT